MKNVKFKLFLAFFCLLFSGLGAHVLQLDSYKQEDKKVLGDILSTNEFKPMGKTIWYDEDSEVKLVWKPKINEDKEKRVSFVAIVEWCGEECSGKVYYFFQTQDDVEEIVKKVGMNSKNDEISWYRLVKKIDPKLS